MMKSAGCAVFILTCEIAYYDIHCSKKKKKKEYTVTLKASQIRRVVHLGLCVHVTESQCSCQLCSSDAPALTVQEGQKAMIKKRL